MSGRALVTGSRGFVGRRLVRRLAAAGWSVAGCDVAAAPDAPDCLCCDLSEPADVERLLDWAGPVTHFFHLAGLTYVPAAIENPSSAMSANYGGTVNLLRAVERRLPEARVLVVGSSDVYGPPQQLPITEDHPLCPVNPYSISKAAADHYCSYMAGRSKLEIVRARPFNHSGPGQNESFVLPSFARQIAGIEAGRVEPVLRVGNLSAARDFLHVDDVLGAYELIATRGRAGQVYNICSGQSHTIQEAMEGLIALAGLSIRWEIDPARWRPGAEPEVRGSHARLTADTGWEPRIGFEGLLKDVLEDWRGRIRE